MCYEYSLRKKALKEQLENRRHQASFWAQVNQWVREARLALAAESRHRKQGKVTS